MTKRLQTANDNGGFQYRARFFKLNQVSTSIATMTALNNTPLMAIALLFLGFSTFGTTTSAFQSISSPNTRRSFSLNMAAKGGGPRFDKATEKWIITDPEVGDGITLAYVVISMQLLLEGLSNLSLKLSPHYTRNITISIICIYRLKDQRQDMT